jgi:hypothetical protein
LDIIKFDHDIPPNGLFYSYFCRFISLASDNAFWARAIPFLHSTQKWLAPLYLLGILARFNRKVAFRHHSRAHHHAFFLAGLRLVAIAANASALDNGPLFSG